MNLPDNYIPVLIQAAVGLGFSVIYFIRITQLGFLKTHFWSYKDDTFECGIEVEGNARTPFFCKIFSYRYFIRFIRHRNCFFFYPYAVNFKELGFEGFLFCCNYVYSNLLHRDFSMY